VRGVLQARRLASSSAAGSNDKEIQQTTQVTFMRHVGSSGGKGHRPPKLRACFVAWFCVRCLRSSESHNPGLQLTLNSEQLEQIITLTVTAGYETPAGGNTCGALVVLLTLCLFFLFVNISNAVKRQSALSLAQAVSCRPLTTKAPVHGQFFVDRVAVRQVISEHIGFPLSVSFHQCSTFIHVSPTPYNISTW
jgi:hypothetical protein